MEFFTQFTNTKARVEAYLRRYPELRDNDEKLIAVFWFNEIKSIPDIKTAFEFLTAYSGGKLTSSESIRRCRQKAQEVNPELRGEKWLLRQLEAEKVRLQMKNN